MRVSLKSVLFASLLVAGTSASGATVQNGGFEDLGGQTINGNWEIFPGIPGWTGSPNVEIQTAATLGSIDPQGTGSNYVELDTNTNSSISQDIDFTIAGNYTLSFYYSPRVNASPTTTNNMSFSLGNADGKIIGEDIDGAPNLDFPWGEWTLVKTAFSIIDTGVYTLKFAAFGEQRTKGCGDCGALLDNVSIAPAPPGGPSVVPLPASSLLLLGGLGVMGGVARCKAKRANA